MFYPIKIVNLPGVHFCSKEIELISNVQTTLSKTLQQTKDQLEACKEAKHRLEMDWSDKYTAQGLGM